MTEEATSQIEAIDRFLADNPELEDLSAKVSAFNLFQTLKIETAEIRHSNVLAWLLDPAESHGLSNIVLRRILSNMFLISNSAKTGISAAKIELMTFDSIEVRREWNNTDIVVIDRTNKFVVLIENKVYSQGYKEQLDKYLHLIKDEFSSFIIIPVFLTLMEDKAGDEQPEYISYSYSQVLSVLEKVFAQRQSQLSEAVAIFLSHYTDILRRLTMQDQELIELCKKVYQKHRTAIDTIFQYGRAGVGQQAVESVLREDESYEELYTSPSWVSFIPKSWAEYVPENGTSWTNLTRPVSVICWFEFPRDTQSVCLTWEVSAMTDSDLRQRCMKELQKAGFKLTKAALKMDAKYSRFYRDSIRVSELTDQEQVKEAAIKLLNRAKTKFSIAEKVFQNVFK